MGNATKLFNMLRDIGGSIGIAMAPTAIIRRADLHQTDLSASRSPSSAALRQKSAVITQYLGLHVGPTNARPCAFGFHYALMEQRAAFLAYVDIFRRTAALPLICAGATRLFKKPEKRIEPSPGVH